MLEDLPLLRAVAKRRRARPSRGTGIGVVDEAVGRAAVEDRLRRLGAAGRQARALDRVVTGSLTGMTELSPITTSLAVGYLERVQTPISALSLASGVLITTRAYAAHRAVEADPAAYGAVDVPVATFPDLRRGRPPQDLLSRVVKATRRNFDAVRAIDRDVWDGFVLLSTQRVHERAGDDADDLAEAEELDDVALAYLDIDVVDGLTRFGWILRQVDIHYGQRPGPGAPREGAGASGA